MLLICQCQLFDWFYTLVPWLAALFGLWVVVGIPLAECHRLWVVVLLGQIFRVFVGEFDPGSGRTLAACLTHASRAERPLRGCSSGERVSNT